MKRTSCIIAALLLILPALHGCSYNCGCKQPDVDDPTALAARPIPTGTQLITECKYIDEGIEDAALLADKMANSRYAVYYQAMSRDRISKLEARAKEIGCD